MNAIHYLTLIIAIAVLLTGCMMPNAPALEPVDTVPDWIEPEEISPGDPEPEIQVFWDNTQSMYGFSGVMDSHISTVAVELTNLVRFDENIATYKLVPNEKETLTWKEEDPLVIASSVLVKDKSGYTYAGEFQHGGPLTAVFQPEPVSNQVRVLITDLLEQESELDVLTSYVQKLFRNESRQQVRIYVADSDYDGFVSYPVVKENKLKIQTTYFAGKRPYAVIVAGPAEGVGQIHQVLMGAGVPFAQFMVENHRSEPDQVSFQPGMILEKSILLEDPSSALCTANLEEHPTLKDCIAYSYRKVTANKVTFSRLSMLAQTELTKELSLGQVYWFRRTAQEDEEGLVAHTWESCEPPDGILLSLTTLASGPAIPDRDAEETGLVDITLPSGCKLWELSVLADEASMGQAYAIQVELTVPAMDNPFASTEAFDEYDISFAAYGNADKNPDILTRIPDLKLMLSALAKLDDATTEDAVADIRIVIQNYETICENNEEE